MGLLGKFSSLFERPRPRLNRTEELSGISSIAFDALNGAEIFTGFIKCLDRPPAKIYLSTYTGRIYGFL